MSLGPKWLGFEQPEGRRANGYCLSNEFVKPLSSRACSASAEAECELIEVVTQVARFDATMVCAHEDNLRVEKVNTELAIERIEARYERGNYSEEKTNEKVAREERRPTEIETKIQSIEDEISLMSSVDIEVQKLKEASKQVRYRVEKLDRRQQRVLCNLFVDKIEMRRVRDGKRWKVQPDIYFRFNPEKLKESVEKSRSQTWLTKAERGSLKEKKS